MLIKRSFVIGAMNISLTKQIFGKLKIPSSDLIGIFGPRKFEGKGLSDEEIRKAIANPIGTEPLREMAKGCENVVIVTDDNTRMTPVSRIVPMVLDELHLAGVPPRGITFLIGLGTHRPMTADEIQTKFGFEVASRYRIVNHAWEDAGDLVSLGPCDLGFEVVINRLALEADLLLAVGSIVPHATAGFSGGGKTIMPGICGEKTIEDTHWKALDFSMREILGRFNNPIRESIVSVSRRVGLRAIVNAILFEGNKIYSLVAGDVEAAHWQGVETCREVYGADIPGQADVVIAEAYPTDIDLRQAIKALCSADIICRDGGVIILPAECPEGIAPQFPEFEHHGFRNPDFLFREVEENKFSQKLMAYTLVAIGRIISQRVRAILVSMNIDQTQAKRMGFQWAPDLQSAMGQALSMVHGHAKVAILKSAGEILPILQ